MLSLSSESVYPQITDPIAQPATKEILSVYGVDTVCFLFVPQSLCVFIYIVLFEKQKNNHLIQEVTFSHNPSQIAFLE